jgi:hypothetical protein
MALDESNVLGPHQVSVHEAEHLIIAFAACQDPQGAAVIKDLPASHTVAVRQLLSGMDRSAIFRGEADSLSPPHERALALALGWPELADGLLPWAAAQAAALGLQTQGPWGQLRLCHWAMGREQASLSEPDLLPIRAEESLALMEDMAPFFAADGLQLHHHSPGLWLVQGSSMDIPTASLDRVISRDVDPWLPSGASARLLRRLQNEMQMLLYTHPINEARAARRQLPINSLWFSGTGCLPAAMRAPQAVHLSRLLAPAAMAGDWAAYAQAWAQLDETVLRPLLARQQAGQSITLTLCGERGFVTLQSAGAGLMSWLTKLLRPHPWPLKEEL